MKDCNGECNRSNCPFRTDPFNRYREVCIKCGRDYDFRNNRFPPLLLLWVLIVAILLLTHNPNSEIEPPGIKPTSQELNSKR